jgi:hypothetical protein
MIDLRIFPPELNLFESESAWRIKNNMAIVNDAEESDIDKAEIILSLNYFKRWDHTEEVLEAYYADGDESVLDEYKVEVPVKAPEVIKEDVEEMGVIIPEARIPPPSYSVGAPIETDESVIIPPSSPQKTEAPPPSYTEERQIPLQLSEDEFIDRIIDRMISRGVLYQPQIAPPSHTQEPSTPQTSSTESTRTSLTAFDELCGLLVDYIRKEVPPKAEEPSLAVSELFRIFKGEPRKDYALFSAVLELLEAASQYLRSRTITQQIQEVQAQRPATEDIKEPTTPSLQEEKPREEVVEGAGEGPISAGEERVDGGYIKYLINYDEARRSQVERFGYLSSHWARLESVLELIAEDPYCEVVGKMVSKRVEVDDIDPDTMEQISTELERLGIGKGAEALDMGELLRSLPFRISEKETAREYDTPENRLLRTHLDALMRELVDLSREIAARRDSLKRAVEWSSGPATVILAGELQDAQLMLTDAEKLKNEIESFRDDRMGFLRGVTMIQSIDPKTLHKHPSYSQFYDLLRHYEKGAPPSLHSNNLVLADE